MNYAIVKNQSLKKHNTLRINAIASLMAFPFNEAGVEEIYRKYNNSKKIIVVGKGSNILFSQKHYNENYLFLNFKLMDNVELSDNGRIHVESGVLLSNLSWFSIENNIKGFEFLEDIPGTIGGAIVMNAGTYQDNIGQLIEEVTSYDIEKEKIVKENVSKGDFGIRHSKWSSCNRVILSCSCTTKPGDYINSLEKLLEVKKNRYLKQPRNYPNAGSVFKRPFAGGEELQVWKLINDCGLRGEKKNGAMISDKHTGFIVNIGDAQYEDILYLIELSKRKVKEKFNVELELEWKTI